MSNINLLVLESEQKKKKKHNDDDLPTHADVAAGYGKWAGGHMAGLPGYGIGYYVGKHVIGDKHKKMDKRSRGHRFGAMLNNSTKLKNIAITTGGALAGALLGGGAGHVVGGKDHHRVIGAASGMATGAALAHHIFGAGKDNRHLAKKLGYGKFGRAAASFTPGAGLFTPKDQDDD